MLTKSDLNNIQKLIHKGNQSINLEFVSELKITRIGLEEKIRSLNLHFKDLSKKISKIQKDQKTITNYFDVEYLRLRKEMDEVKNQLGLSSQ
jgi:predicted  nucleic acid-binding Zn-ribbon protein